MVLTKHHTDFSETDFINGEVLLVDKPLRWTSFDVVSKIRNALKPLKLKVGHAGTLDPLATGLLIVCTGKKTKTIDTIQAQEKEYTGVFHLGATTPSYDLETDINQRFDIDHLDNDRIHQATQAFMGEIAQIPPAHSAVKIGGERLYEKARRGEAVEKRPRMVRISAFEITGIQLPEVHFRVACSKGTYIRSLAHDFGQSLGTGAYLQSLRRTRSGDYSVDQAWALDALIEAIRVLRPRHEALRNNQK